MYAATGDGIVSASQAGSDNEKKRGILVDDTSRFDAQILMDIARFLAKNMPMVHNLTAILCLHLITGAPICETSEYLRFPSGQIYISRCPNFRAAKSSSTLGKRTPFFA